MLNQPPKPKPTQIQRYYSRSPNHVCSHEPHMRQTHKPNEVHNQTQTQFAASAQRQTTYTITLHPTASHPQRTLDDLIHGSGRPTTQLTLKLTPTPKNQPPTTNHNLISSDEPNPGQTTGSNNWLHTKYQRAWTLKPWAVNHFWFQTPNPRNTPNVMFHTPNAVQHFLMRRSQQNNNIYSTVYLYFSLHIKLTKFILKLVIKFM